MTRVFFYKLTSDSGGAPCVRRGLLSLAICKPMIRSTARVGDLIFGFAANSLHPDNRLLYAARFTSVLRNGKYYKDRRYAQRGDCIYMFKVGRFARRKGAQHHPRAEDLVHDLGRHPDYPRANVLLSNNFRYFGRAGGHEYKAKYPRVKRAVEQLGRGHRVRYDRALHNELLDMERWVWRSAGHKVMGPPTSAPSRSTCHRGRSCGLVFDTKNA